MKNILSLLSIITLSFLWTSCKKVDTDPNALDFYKNKTIVLTIASEDIKVADYFEVKISAVALEDRKESNPRIIINGNAVEGEYGVVTKDMLLDGPVTITARDKAWQYVAEYAVSASGAAYSVSWNSTFNDIPQETIVQKVISPSITRGIIEIKEYK